MASAAEQAALTVAFIAQQKLQASTLARDLVLLVRAIFSVNDPDHSWPAAKMVLDSMIRDRRRASGDSARLYYVRARDLAVTPRAARRQPARTPFAEIPVLGGPDGTAAEDFADTPEDEAPDRITPAEPKDLPAERVDATLNATGIASYKKALRAGQTPERARDTMAVNLLGAAQSLVLEGGREVIHETVLSDDEAIGWARITDADPCAFCSMLASRGAVYRSAETAGGRTDKGFVGEGMFKFHNHDSCTAVPVFSPDDPVLDRAEDLYDQWLEVTAQHSGQAAFDAWRKHWDNRDDRPQPAEG